MVYKWNQQGYNLALLSLVPRPPAHREPAWVRYSLDLVPSPTCPGPMQDCEKVWLTTVARKDLPTINNQRFRKIDIFERNNSFSRMTSCNYWKVIPQFVPLNGLHADICVLRIGAVQAERAYIFLQWKFVWEKIKTSVTSTYIECATGKWYHSIELTNSFLLKYRYWTFTKITASAS